MKAPPSGPGIGASRGAPGTGIDDGKRRMWVFIGLSLLLHLGMLGMGLPQPQLVTPATVAREARLDLRLRPQGTTPAPATPPVHSLLTETTPPRPDRPASPAPLPARPRNTSTTSTTSTTSATSATLATSENSEAPQAARTDAVTSDEAVTVPPAIDYAVARETARQTARSPRQAKPEFEIPTPPPAEPETALGKSIQRSVHPDCRTRYAGAGLLAIPLLINDAVREGGCQW